MDRLSMMHHLQHHADAFRQWHGAQVRKDVAALSHRLPGKGRSGRGAVRTHPGLQLLQELLQVDRGRVVPLRLSSGARGGSTWVLLIGRVGEVVVQALVYGLLLLLLLLLERPVGEYRGVREGGGLEGRELVLQRARCGRAVVSGRGRLLRVLWRRGRYRAGIR